MSDDTNGSTSGRLAKKLLMPVVATVVSAAAGYAGKKAPKLLDEKVMPKLRNAASGSEGLAHRAKGAVGGDGGGDNGSRSHQLRNGSVSDKEREQKRRARAEQRQARRSGSRS